MKQQRISGFSIFILLIVILFLTSTFASGQSDSDLSSDSLKSPLSDEFNKKAVDKLSKMSPKEVEDLDKMLAEALTLFYDREYARALPIFQEISGKIENMDVMFWYASCAAKAGENELAIKKYKQMLDIDPQLHRVRLELATVYFGMQRYDEARQELQKVLDINPPENVQNNINRLLAAIDEKTKRLYTNFRFSAGIQRDLNVNSAPDDVILYLPPGGGIGGAGGTLALSTEQRALMDYVITDNLSGNILYDIGENKGWMWNSTGSLYQSHVQEYHKFGSSQVKVTTGPWLIKPTSVLKLPVGYAKNRYEYDSLFDSIEFSPSYEYFFRKNISLKGTFTYSKDEYIPDNRWSEENINRIIELNPNIYFNNKKDILSFFISDENLNANALRYSYDALNLAVSYFKPLKWDLEFYTRFKYTDKEYEGPVALWPFDRKDKKYNFYVVLSKNFWKRYFVSANYNFIGNDSNTDLYTYHKNLYGLNMGFKF